MTVWNTWLGRRIAPSLVTILIASTCQAAATSQISYNPGSSSSAKLGYAASADEAWVSSATFSQQDASGQEAAGQNQNQPQIPAPSAPPANSPAEPQTAPAPPAPAPIARPQADAPIVRPTSPQEQPAPASPVQVPLQDQTPPQQFNKDLQYSTPAATQQLIPRTASGQPATLPAAPPEPPPGPPVGTAAAPVITATGTAGSRVAGAAVAPAKQRRIRTFAVRAALLLGAAAAIGIVVAASKASPTRAN